MLIETSEEDGKQDRIRTLEDIGGKTVDLRCKFCAKLLAWNNIDHLTLDVRCAGCSNVNSFQYDTDQHIYLTDNTGKILYVNEQVERVTGYTSQEVIGKTPAIWGKQMPQHFYKELWTDILQNKKSVVVHMTNCRKNGQLYKAITRIAPITNEKGKVVFFLAIQSLVELL